MKTPLIALCIGLLLPAAALHAQTAAELFSKYEKAEKAGDWTAAEKIARTGLAKFPAEEGFASCLAWALRRQQKYAEALAAIEPAYRKNPANANLRDNYLYALIERGWELYNAKDLKSALDVFKKAFALAPEDEWALNAWGVALRDSGNLDEGIGVLEQGRARFPGNKYLRDNLVWAYVLKAQALSSEIMVQNPNIKVDWAPVEAWFVKAAAVNPEDENYLINYGLFLVRTSRPDEALPLFEKGEKLFPGNRYFTENLIWALLLKERACLAAKDYDGAIVIIEKVRRRFPDEGWLIVDLCDAWWGKNEYEQSGRALAVFAELKNPREYRQTFTFDRAELVYYRLMRLIWKFAEVKKLAAGAALLKRIEAGFPGAWFVTEARGLLEYHSGNRAKGIALVNEAFDQYIARHPDARKTLTLDLPLKGMYLVGGNNRTDAITHAGLNRFCYDFMGANEKGEVLKPGEVFPGKANDDYLGFGAAIYSPVDGVVEELVDRYDDMTPRAEPVLGDANSITVKDEAGFHYLFVHNRRGSARVAQGQRVKKGDLLAEIGNNGYSAQPHFHFGVYTPDWRVSVEVRFSSYALLKAGAKEKIENGLPSTGDIIEK